MRNVPLLLKHYETNNTSPELFALGFAAYLYFTKPVKEAGGKYFGEYNGREYPIQDEMAESYMKRWNNFAPPELVKEVLSDISLWEHNLFILPGFYESVLEKLNLIINSGAKAAMRSFQLKKALT